MFGGMFLIWILIVVGLVWFFKYMIDFNRSPRNESRQSKSALDISRERYARGEINKNEFEERRRDLLSSV